MYSLYHEAPQTPKVPISRWVEAVLLSVGFLCLLWVGGTLGYASLTQRYENYQLDQAIRGRPVTWIGFLRSIRWTRSETASPVPEEQVRRDRPPIELGGLIGRVEVPRLQLSATVREGVEEKTLRRAVGHVPNTALPGEPGNFGIAAHRDTYFRGLRDVRKGDLIRVVTPERTFEYEVDSMKIVLPENVEVLDPTSEPVVTLVTCYPFNYVGSAPKRFIVRARQISPEPVLRRQRS